MNSDEKVRLDKYLWAVRIYKTRSLAAEACQGGKVKVNGESVKASKTIGINDIISLHKDMMHLKYRVLQLLEKRLSAALIKDYLEDLTPADEFENKKLVQRSTFYRPKGLGRPTKKEKRLIDKVREN